MATMTETTTDKRVDDLRAEMHEGFARTDIRINDLRSEMHRGFDRIETDVRDLRSEVRAGNSTLRAEMKAGDDGLKESIAAIDSKFDLMQRLMIRFFAGTLGSIIAGVALLFFSHH